MEGTPLRMAMKKLIAEVYQEMQADLQSAVTPEPGTITAVNADGTVNVSTSVNTYTNIGSPIQQTLGAQVLVITTAEGLKTTVPH